MTSNNILECIEFFNELEVVERDITKDVASPEEIADGVKIVEVDYSYHGQTYTTAKLFYKNILNQDLVKEPSKIHNYFGVDVFWLDPVKHHWKEEKDSPIKIDKIVDDMISGQNEKFKELLLKIANDSKNGFLQLITDEGRGKKPSLGFPRFNHWHDCIFLIKAMINSSGEEVSKRYFSKLVFEYPFFRAPRTSLGYVNKLDSREFVTKLYSNIKSIQNQKPPSELPMETLSETEELKILKQKKQIILQGPPGTGKTYTAKDLAEQIIFSSISKDKKEQKKLLESTDQFKLIQFHPAYSYEDFVRGIVANSKDNFIEYVTENKVLAQFAIDANKNWIASNEPKKEIAKEAWVKKTLDDFKDYLSDEIEDKDEKLRLTPKVYIHRIVENSIRYNSDAWSIDGGVPDNDIVKMYLANNASRQQVKENQSLSKSAKNYPTYWLKMLELFKKYIADKNLKPDENSTEIKEKPFVLIIDEINRANLPAVLGELIYALEYRGEKVESMYATDEGNTIVIPPNLLIIGTMNTSDRSVGHIDYAIRRRFAFIDVLPKVLDNDKFEAELFKKVSSLFIKNFDAYENDNTVKLEQAEHLSEEFRPEDVWLGHSYFIKNEGDFELRIKYEIIPILKEYVKDGILKQSAEAIINEL